MPSFKNEFEKAEFDRIFQEAINARLDGQYLRAIEIGQGLFAKYPRPVLLWYVAGIYLWDLEDYKRAIDVYRQTIQLSPRNESASVGLFFALKGAGLKDEAMEEMVRYVSAYGVKRKYQRIMDEMEEGLAAAEKESIEVKDIVDI